MTLSLCASCMCDCLICGWPVVPYQPLPPYPPALPVPPPPSILQYSCCGSSVCVCVRCPVWFFWTSLLNLPPHLPSFLTRPTSCRCRSGHQRGDHVHSGAAEGRHRAGGGQRGGQPRHAVSQGQGAEAHRGPHAREEGREGEVAVTFTWLDGSSSSFVFFLFCFSKKTQFVLYVLWDAACVPLWTN